jgi:hypothetical protein
MPCLCTNRLHPVVLLSIQDASDIADSTIYLLFDKSDTLNVRRMAVQTHSCRMTPFNGSPGTKSRRRVGHHALPMRILIGMRGASLCPMDGLDRDTVEDGGTRLELGTGSFNTFEFKITFVLTPHISTQHECIRG